MIRYPMCSPDPSEPNGAAGAGGDPLDSTDAYLWDKTGAPDPDVVRLEQILAPTRLKKPLAIRVDEPGESSGTSSIATPPTFPVRVSRTNRGGARVPRDHRRRRFAWVLPALGTLALFAIMAFIAWPMRPWGPGTQTGTPNNGGIAQVDPNSPSTATPVLTDWHVEPTAGAPTIGPKALAASQPVALNQWIETDRHSSAKLTSASIGDVVVEPNSRVRVKSIKKRQHWLELTQGRIRASTHVPPELFFVETPSAIAVDMGCAYELEVDAKGSGVLHVTLGWVELQKGDKAVRVTRGNKCAIRAGVGPGTPVNEDASDFLVAAVARFDEFGTNPKVAMKSRPIDDILAVAGKTKVPTDDAVMLWHVLREVDSSERERVINALGSIVPIPDNVTRDALLNVEPKALDEWWDRIRFR